MVYDVTTFLDKNMDKLHADVTSLLKESSVPLIVDLFTNPAYGGSAAANEGQDASAQSHVCDLSHSPCS